MSCCYKHAMIQNISKCLRKLFTMCAEHLLSTRVLVIQSAYHRSEAKVNQWNGSHLYHAHASPALFSPIDPSWLVGQYYRYE